MSLGQVLLANLVVISIPMGLLWLASIFKKDASIMDSFWGLGFVLVSWATYSAVGHVSQRGLLLAVLVSVWGVRLSGYLTWRKWGKPEDYRYAAMRRHHGSRFPLVSLLTVFVLQGAIMWVVSLPVQVGIAQPGASQLPAWIGTSCFLAGLLFETVGDYQLARFKANPANHGTVMRQGLWRYTRHPNYFGDFLVWWGIYLVAAVSTTWWWIIAGPSLMSFLLIRVSGVRLLEGSLNTRVAGYQEYVNTTSAFFPLPPRKPASSA